MSHRRKKRNQQRGFAAIGLQDPKFAVNVGSAIRAAGCYEASMVAIAGNDRYKRAPTDTMKTYRHIPIFQVDDLHDVIPFDCVPVAVELVDEAISLFDYKHPQRAFYIFGAEDQTLGKKVLSWCKDIVCIPTNGCMNLAATVNVVLYDRMMKGWK